MPSFNIQCKTLADDDGWERGLAPFFPDQGQALDFFNKTMAREEKLGQFTFDDTGEPSDYTLVEIENSPTGEERRLHLLYLLKT